MAVERRAPRPLNTRGCNRSDDVTGTIRHGVIFPCLHHRKCASIRCYSDVIAARLLGMLDQNLTNLRVSGALPFVKSAQASLIRHTDIAKYLQRNSSANRGADAR